MLGMHSESSNFLLDTWFTQRNLAEDTPDNQKLTLRSVYNYTISLQNCVEIWYKLFNPSETDLNNEIKIWLDKINRMNIEGIPTLLLIFFTEETSNEKRVEFLRSLERFLFIYQTYGYARYRQYRIPLARNIIEWTDKIEKTGLSEITNRINNESSNIINSKNFIESLKEQFTRKKGFYAWSLIGYFLFEYELNLQKKSRTKRTKISWDNIQEDKEDFITIEHILPQKDNNEDWTAFKNCSPELKNKLCHSLGNLLPLSRPKNSSLQNKPFLEKVNGDRTKCVGYRYGSYAENEICYYTEWTPEIILNRGLELLNFMEERWKIRLGNKEERISLLGLEDLKGIISSENDNI